MTEHSLTIPPQNFRAVQSGRKTRVLQSEATQPFAVGDGLVLHEYDDSVPITSVLEHWACTGACCRARVTCVSRSVMRQSRSGVFYSPQKG